MKWKDWQNVSFSERHRMPSYSGIHLIADANNCVWYTGQAGNLRDRWAGKGHHRYPQLIRSSRKLCHRIYWKQVQANCLDEQEQYYIDLFKPELNGCKVKKYLPKQPQVERELKRLLKVLNKSTLLFPVLRSVIAGEYEGNDGIRCTVVVTNSNDFEILYKSTHKRYAAEVRKAWTEYKTYCGKDEQSYSCKWLPAYSLNGCRVEFVEASELLQHLKDNLRAYKRYVDIAELFGVQVKALKDLSILNELSINEEYSFTNSDGKKSLRDIAYINYRKHMLKCLVNT